MASHPIVSIVSVRVYLWFLGAAKILCYRETRTLRRPEL